MTDEMELVECPYCDYGPAPEDSVVGHMTSAKAGRHDGIGGPSARRILNGETPGGDESPAESADSADSSGEYADSADSHDPDMAEDPTLSEPDTGSTEPGGRDRGTAPDDPGPCPACDGELIDARGEETLRTADGRIVYAPDQFYCSNCGQGYNWRGER